MRRILPYILTVIIGGLCMLHGCNAVNIPAADLIGANDLQSELAVKSLQVRDGNMTRSDAANLLEKAAIWFKTISELETVSPAFRNQAQSFHNILNRQAEAVRTGEATPEYGAQAMEDAVRTIDLFKRADAGLPARGDGI